MTEAVAHQDQGPASDLLAASDAVLGMLEELNMRGVEHAPAELHMTAVRLMAQSGAHPSSDTVQGLVDGMFDAQLWILSMRRGAARRGGA
jgi:hypothetical protein